jgi:outer membrane immunogenic protein
LPFSNYWKGIVLRNLLIIIGVSSILAGAPLSAALAADMPLKALPAPAPVMSWTGWYVGLNAGGIWPNSDGVTHSATGVCNPVFLGCFGALPLYSDTASAGSTFNSSLGNGAAFTGGGQFGYNWQFNGRGLLGFEADIAWTGQHSSTVFNSTTPNVNFPGFPEVYGAAVSRNLDYLGTVRGRLGFLATPSFLLYGTGGLAYGGTRSTTIENIMLAQCSAASCVTGLGGGGFSQARAGWTVGAGGEWMFAPNWSVKAEYLYYDLGSVNYATAVSQVCTGAPCAINGGTFVSSTGTTSLRYNGSIARVGVNWHFNGPILAKY